jgi:hypothetical protein
VVGIGSIYSSISRYGSKTMGIVASSTRFSYAPASSDAYSDASAKIDVDSPYASIFDAFLVEILTKVQDFYLFIGVMQRKSLQY